jgi:hypothetical protein
VACPKGEGFLTLIFCFLVLVQCNAIAAKMLVDVVADCPMNTYSLIQTARVPKTLPARSTALYPCLISSVNAIAPIPADPAAVARRMVRIGRGVAGFAYWLENRTRDWAFGGRNREARAQLLQVHGVAWSKTAANLKALMTIAFAGGQNYHRLSII